MVDVNSEVVYRDVREALDLLAVRAPTVAGVRPHPRRLEGALPVVVLVDLPLVEVGRAQRALEQAIEGARGKAYIMGTAQTLVDGAVASESLVTLTVSLEPGPPTLPGQVERVRESERP